MIYFKKLNFNNYRNFSKSSFSFEKGCNIIIGRNGSGKTNVLEGISLFEKGRGIRKEKINNLVNFHNINQGFKINSTFQNQKIDFKIDIFNSNKKLKKLSVNDSFDRESIKYFEYEHKFHCGHLPGSFFSPYPDPSCVAIEGNNPHVFFSIYFMMTGLHGLHVIVGMLLITWLIFRTRKGHFPSSWVPSLGV